MPKSESKSESSSAEPASESILVETPAPGIRLIRLNRPDRLNALTNEMTRVGLPGACAAAAADPDVRVVMITGAGRAFCAGADVQERLAGPSGVRRRTSERIGEYIVPVVALPKPVIAVVNGVAAGSGFSLAAAADFRFVSSGAAFVASFVRLGLMPDGGLTYTLPQIIGRSRAANVLMTGRSVRADEALELGLADRVLEPDQLFDDALSFATELAAGPPLALAFTKRALRRDYVQGFDQQLDFESWGQHACFATDDFAEGLHAFEERRPPSFAGR
jgi:2-(1,2-epoxy-1,2-dihydrophenyl)acetyl-CoA isomerase